MNNSQIPAKIPTPWANAGIRNTIPGPSQIAVTPGAASFTDGFPPLNATAISAGGVPPAIGDMNGALYDVTVTEQWLEAGGGWPFDATFATAIGGYPSGAVIPSADGTGWWRNTADNNSANPDTGGTGWVPHFFYGVATQALAGANVTLTATQYCKPQIVLTGALSANVVLTFPAMALQWLVVNNTTGAYTVTATTASGTGVVLGGGANPIFGDGTNIYGAVASHSTLSPMTVGAAAAATGTVAWSGWERRPGGFCRQFATIQIIDNLGASPVTWTLPNPTLFQNGILGFKSSNLAVMAGQGGGAGPALQGMVNLGGSSGVPVTALTLYGHNTNSGGTQFWAYVEVEGY